MNQKKKDYTFPIEKKLATIEWNLKLLNTSVTTTHTPLCTLKSMIKASVVLPTKDVLEKIIDSPSGKSEHCSTLEAKPFLNTLNNHCNRTNT
jgi:hypothetical protein